MKQHLVLNPHDTHSFSFRLSACGLWCDFCYFYAFCNCACPSVVVLVRTRGLFGVGGRDSTSRQVTTEIVVVSVIVARILAINSFFFYLTKNLITDPNDHKYYF